jgi:hypothetical protein
MSAEWKDRAPEGVENIAETAEGFTAEVSIPLTEDGFLGRCCPSCERWFTIDADRWRALDSEATVTCCYCGAVGEGSSYLTHGQTDRVIGAAHALGVEYARQSLQEMLRGLERPRRRGSMFSVEVELSPPGPITQLRELIEEQARRIITSPSCAVRYGVVGEVAFCPLCGRREVADSVADAIAASRLTLAIEDALDEETRETARANGVFDRFAADALKAVVTQFELATKADFTRRVSTAESILGRESGNVFQRLDDVQRLYREHANLDVPAAVGAALWCDLAVIFQKRHVLIHLDGHVDQRYLDRVPDATLQVGQRLVLSRADAEQALADLDQALDRITAA